MHTDTHTASRDKAFALLDGHIRALRAGIKVCPPMHSYQAKLYLKRLKLDRAKLARGEFSDTFILCEYGPNLYGPSIADVANSCHRFARMYEARAVAA